MPCSPELRACVDALIADGKPEDSAWAICRSQIGESRHPDFERILAGFKQFYGDTADKEYYSWLNSLKLDESSPYGRTHESFPWNKSMIQRLKEDIDNVYYNVDVGFPWQTMNNTTYMQDDLEATTRSLLDVSLNLNHKPEFLLPTVKYVEAEFHEGISKALLKVPKNVECPVCGEGKKLYQLIDEHKIVNVSLEGNCVSGGGPGAKCDGFAYTGCALLTTDVLPGIPMARIFPLESLVREAVSQSQTIKKDSLKVVIELSKPETKQQPEPQKQPAPQTATDASSSVTALKVDNYKLQAEVKSLQARCADLENQMTQNTTAKEQAEGQIRELKAMIDRMEKSAERSVSDMHDADKRLIEWQRKCDDWQRKCEDIGVNRDEYKSQVEKLSTENADLNAKYQKALKEVLGYSKEVTQSKEEYLAVSKQLEQTEERLKKAKRLGHLQVKV